ncbi:MAG: tRNA (adenosine(37)-N6)-dimethylallyltransferase MiaA [Planctomycetota bacterium]|nr:tRNA (adenosine(37)-N6)-dimethylallyltransferase MiaA [Planctomycetota bacterium]
MSERPTIVICGPTAGGKSALAVECALRLRARGVAAEIISADAFQVYRGMDIGTAKPTLDERRGVPHHLIDIVDPTEGFTASDWLARAEVAIASVREQGGTPIVVGGTHLYVKLLIDGMFAGPGEDAELRRTLRAMPPESLRAELERVDPVAASRLHPNDLRRTIRALEVFRLTGLPITAHQRQWQERTSPSPTGAGFAPDSADPHRLLVFALDWPVESINRSINARVRAMVERGLINEARSLFDQGVLGHQAREALGYKQLFCHFQGRLSLNDAIEQIKIATRRFAKSQRTWLRRLSAGANFRWIPAAAMLEGTITQPSAPAPAEAAHGRAPQGDELAREPNTMASAAIATTPRTTATVPSDRPHPEESARVNLEEQARLVLRHAGFNVAG